jgi:hypothetical protein
MSMFCTDKISPNLHFASPLAKQNGKHNKDISPLSWENGCIECMQQAF